MKCARPLVPTTTLMTLYLMRRIPIWGCVVRYRAGKELYVAETDGKVLVKIGSAKWQPEEGSRWVEASSGSAWAVYERL